MVSLTVGTDGLGHDVTVTKPLGHGFDEQAVRTLQEIVGIVLFFVWLKDIRNASKHTVVVNAATPVFVGTGDQGGCHGTKLTTVELGNRLAVRRIRYLKDCVTLDVSLPDRRLGYVVLGIGDVSVTPSLPTT